MQHAQCDLTKTSEITAMFDWIHREDDLGRVDVCMANAGTCNPSSLLEGLPQDLKDLRLEQIPISSGGLAAAPEEWKKLLDLNVLALCLCTQLSIKSMVKVGE